ncbi:MAG: hypothetical protein V4594_18260 [Bacteroidota bacterium]
MEEINIIRGSIWHVLNFLTLTVMEYAFTLAMEKELADLKGLVRPGVISDSEDKDAGICVLDTELELLAILDDPAIKILLDTIGNLLASADTYRIVTGLDVEELVTDDRYNDMAADTWQSMYYEIFGKNYESILADAVCLYQAVNYMIYICVCQLKYEEMDIFDVADDEYGRCMFDIIDGVIQVEDSKAQLLMDLIADIQLKSIKISAC